MRAPGIDTPYAILVDGRLYAYGDDWHQARDNFLRWINDLPPMLRQIVINSARYVALSDEDASEVAECISADVLVWED